MGSGANDNALFRARLCERATPLAAFVNMRGRSAVDQQTQQLRPAVMAARVHHLFAFVDQREVEVGNDHAFTRTNGLAQQLPSGATMAVKQPPEIGPMLHPVSFMICAC